MLIGLTGRAQAGKDTVYKRIAHLFPEEAVERRSFADPLYQSAAALLGISVKDLQDWKLDPSVSLKLIDRTYDEKTVRSLSIREYLQRYGTEAHRDIFGPDFWVDQVDLSHDGKIVCVTDVRFENEAAAIREAGGFVFHLFGPHDKSAAGHASEAGVPMSMRDFIVDNSARDDDFRALDAELERIVGSLGMVTSA